MTSQSNLIAHAYTIPDPHTSASTTKKTTAMTSNLNIASAYSPRSNGYPAMDRHRSPQNTAHPANRHRIHVMSLPQGTNDIWLSTDQLPTTPSHFRLAEFATLQGLVMLHRSVLVSLERLRLDLAAAINYPVSIIITDAVRTQQYNHSLGARLGWTDQGGKVSRNSMHLAKYGGIAVDIIATLYQSHTRIPQHQLGRECRRHFYFVQDNYPDGHVHCDNRNILPT